MSIPPGMTWQDFLEQTLNDLVKIRNKSFDYYEDWATLPAGVKTALKAKFNTAVINAKANLDDINAAVQAL